MNDYIQNSLKSNIIKQLLHAQTTANPANANQFQKSSSSGNSLCTTSLNQILSWLSRLNTNTLLGQDIDEQGRWTVLFGRIHGLVLLVALDVFDVHVKEVGGVHWSTFGFGMELGGEDGAGFVDHA